MIAGAHVEILEEGIKPSRRSKEISGLIADSLGVKPGGFSQSDSLLCEILRVRISVYFLAKIAINLGIAGFEDLRDLQGGEWLSGYGKLGQGTCLLQLARR